MAENGFDFDLRIQRLTERHEALSESVELLIAGIEALKGTVERQHGKIALLASKPRSHNSASQSSINGAAPAWREKNGSLSDDT